MPERTLDRAFIDATRRKIEDAIVPVMEQLYGHGRVTFDKKFKPELKSVEKIVVFYDYKACGISVLAPLAATHPRARRLVGILLKNMEHYRTHVYGQPVEHYGTFTIPLRRLLFHAALAYRALEPHLSATEKRQFRSLIEQQVETAIEHNAHFHPNVRDLHLGYANNHGAIFGQAIYYCGEIFKRPDWTRIGREFSQRLFASGHPDGYWEEHTNTKREGGPSILYTPLTAGCLYDVLDGKKHAQPKFVKAGAFYRNFLNFNDEPMPVADERSNFHGSGFSYGLALHSLTPQGRSYIVDNLTRRNFEKLDPESLGVLHHELTLMRLGPCTPAENRVDGKYRIALPLGAVRKQGWSAGISAMRALNRTRSAASDYALDQQSMVYLAHRTAGVILTGFKSKNDPGYSTFRIGADAYTDRTGKLSLRSDGADARLFYGTFEAAIRWDLRRTARLTLSVNDPREVVTTLPITNPKHVRSNTKFEVVELKGFSPYTTGNVSETIKAVRFKWRKKCVIEFQP